MTKGRRILVLAAAALASGSASAWAGKYAAMGEVPVSGGELRLVDPRPGAQAPGGAAAAGEVIAFPLKHTDVDIVVDGAMARVKVEQLFENPFPDPIEAVYVFPLSHEAAVHDYEITIGDRTVKGQIDTRDNARQKYESARENGQTAGLMEQHKDNVFSQSVANIPPHRQVRVRFSYVERLEHRDGNYQLVYPMVVGPRYLPQTTTDPHPVGAQPAGTPAPGGMVSVPYLQPGVRSGHDISLHVRVDAGVPIQMLSSPSHQLVEKRLDATTADVQLAPADTVPNKDFVLRFSGAGSATMVGLLAHRAGSGDGYFTLIVQPKASYKTGDITARELVMIVDRSGSMDGQPLEASKQLMLALLGTLTDRDRFNVIAFADGTDALAPDPVPGNAANRARGEAWIRALRAGGGTELGSGVAAGLFHKPGDDRVRMVYVMTDGDVGNDDEIVAAIKKTTGFNRIFPIGMGSSPNRSLLDRLGRVGRGFTSYLLPSESAGDLSAQLVRRTAYPYLTDVKIDWGGLAVKDVTPAAVADVFAGIPLVLSGKYARPGSATIKVSALVAGRRVTTPLEVTLPETSDRPGVVYLWARERVRELQDSDLDPAAIAAAITKLGLFYHLVTAYTSFVAVDQEKVVGADGHPKTIVQPVDMPDGTSWEGNFGAPSNTPYAMTGGGYGGGSSGGGSYSGSSSGSGGSSGYRGGGGGGAVDPFTLTGIGVLAVALRRSRRKRAEKRS